MDYIPVSKCRDGYLYRIKARNAGVGIYEESTGSFIIRRRKFGTVFIAREIHWDVDENFGTVKPLEELEHAPKFESNKETLNYLCEGDRQ